MSKTILSPLNVALMALIANISEPTEEQKTDIANIQNAIAFYEKENPLAALDLKKFPFEAGSEIDLAFQRLQKNPKVLARVGKLREAMAKVAEDSTKPSNKSVLTKSKNSLNDTISLEEPKITKDATERVWIAQWLLTNAEVPKDEKKNGKKTEKTEPATATATANEPATV